MRLFRPAALLSVFLLVPVAGVTAQQPASKQAPINYSLTTSSTAARAHFVEGQHALDMGRALVAYAHFSQAAQADPTFALAHLQAANTSITIADYTAHLQHAVQNAAKATEAERLLIEIAQRETTDDVEGELALAEKLVRLEPTNPRAWQELADIQSRLNRHEEARATLTKAVGLAAEFVPVHAQLGNSFLYSEPRDLAKAEEHFKHASDLQPKEPYFHDLLGDVYRAQGQLEKARTAYTRAAELDPKDGSPLQQRGHVNSFLGRYDAARADYDAAIALGTGNDKASYGVWRALVSLHAGNAKAAVEELDKLVQSIDALNVPEPAGQKVFALSEQALIAIHNKMFDVAERALKQRAELVRKMAQTVGTDEYKRLQEADILYFDGLLAARRGDYATATAKANEYMTVLEANKNPRKNERAHELMGLVALLQGQHAEAVTHYRHADLNDTFVAYHLALALDGAGQKEEAKTLFRKVAGYNFNNASQALIRKDALRRAM